MTKTPHSQEQLEVPQPTGAWATTESQVPPKVSSSQREFFLATVASQLLDSRTNLIHLINSITKIKLVEFWGTFSQDRTADYECLAKEIQTPENTFQEFEGNPGDQCLVQIDGTWYRSRIVSRNGLKYSVFLIDRGMTYSTITSKLAWGKKNHFNLPPEVELCVLANVLPLSPESRWSPVALEFLKSLSGKSFKAHVQDVLVSYRTFLLHIPSISKQMYEMGIAKKLFPDQFQDFVLTSLQSHSGAELSPGIQPVSMGAGERLHKQEVFMYPELPTGTVETVIVTDVTHPQRIFCQLKVFSQELKKLSDQITQCCEGRMTNCTVGPEMIGFPCAARASDGRWYRSVLQQVFPTNKVVEVLNVDYGTKRFVQVENVRPLATEFFRMPVVTYICSLHGIIDKGVGWTTSQIDYLRTLLLYKTVIAKFEYQSISEGVHYVTLYGDENTNLNNLFGSKENCLLEFGKTLGNYAIRSTAYSCQHPAQKETNQGNMLTPGQAVEGKEGKGILEMIPAEDLTLNSSHMAVVQHVSDPSEFWIQTQNYANELDELTDGIYHLYKDSINKDVVRNPTVGLYCAAKAEDGDFYRATVTEVGNTQIKVFFVDYGNTEMVDRSNIRTLPDKFKNLPRLSLKCSLAGIRPKDGRWSQSACDFLIRAVTNKVLNVHVTAKYDEGYVVHLTDPDAQGETDLGTLMCSSGLAERAETERQPKAKKQPAILPPTQLPDVRLTGVYRNSEMSFQALNTAGRTSNERKISTFKEHMFPIGSILDVSVSYIESPNDFWCQLVQNAGHLKMLMHDIQAHYAGSEFQPPVETACVARHPENGMWYRALVIQKHETPHVDVLFVDYGQMETVSLYDLRRICPEFLLLRGQAFRCSLLNPVDPTSATNEWTEEAIARFHSFVKTAASNFVILKCTIYAVMYSEQKIVFNIVDLETPFESVSTSMVNLVKSAPPKKAAGPSFRLDTYYYSTHNVKTGTEELVTVTCVNNVGQFYCQLDRNADVIKDLKIRVSNLCHQLENVKLPTVFGTLCFAKYTDGQWYRGQIKATKPAILVHFVDYGDTIEVDKSDLLPVPREASDIMSVPVQAVLCGLSDVPTDVSSEVNSWFETSATECEFRALIVAREPDGKLLVELYHGNTQINSKIKKMFQIEMHTGKPFACQGRRAPEASANHAQKTPKTAPKQATEMEDRAQTIKKNSSAPKPARQMRDAGMNVQSAPKPRHAFENGHKIKAAPLELYRPPQQRQSCGRTQNNTGNGSEPGDASVKPRKEGLPTETKRLIKSKPPCTESQKESNVEKLPKLADLPPQSVTSGMEVDVYVSHYNSPLSFYVQLLREEDGIFSLVEKLNDPQSIPQTNNIGDMHPGDLVQAEFADDSSWYRAVIREIHSNMVALVEFVDFGNTAMIPISKLGRLHKSFLQPPMYSIHCMLSDAAALGKEKVLHPEVVAAFKEDIGGNGEKLLKCHFIRQSGSVWEVSLKESGVNVTCKIPARCSTDDSEIVSEKLNQVEQKPVQNSNDRQVPEKSPCALCYHHQEFLEGQKLEVYITTTNDAQTFWCQPADSEKLDKVTSRVSEVGEAADDKPVDPDSLFPGTPCIALFLDDHLWYRAEVIDKESDKLLVFFVDYGNNSQVSITDVREMPSDLMETPPQAFFCELEGFDASNGFWDSGAVDELSRLTADRILQLTVTKVTREEGRIKCLVQMECEGQVINETLKTWWKSSTTENKPDAVRLTTFNETMDTAVAYPESKHREEQSTVELVNPHTADEVPKVEGSPENSRSSEDSIYSESFAELPEEARNQNSSECNIITGPQILKTTEILRETVSSEVVNIDYLSYERGMDETLLPSLDSNVEKAILTCDKSAVATDKGTEEEVAPVMGTIGPEDFSFRMDENLLEATDDSDVPTTDYESQPGEVNTCSMERGFDIMIFSDTAEERNDSEVSIGRDNSLTSTTTVKMVPREAVCPRGSIDPFEITDNVSKDFCQVHGVVDSPTEQDIEAGDGVPKEEVPCTATHMEHTDDSFEYLTVLTSLTWCEVDKALRSVMDNLFQSDLMPQEKTPARYEDAYSETLSEQEIEHGDVSLQDEATPYKSKLVEEVTCLVGEICLKDVCRDPRQEDETEDGEQLMQTPPEQEEDFSDGELMEEMSSFDDSFEVQLSKITHLSLIINDGSADILRAEQRPEE
ncbi:hypothetical protein L3Q82_001266 [Scortum barcoo]|uniref:Uncharacterized protein n=1 Tax=Scortum barcoo TaxID=214431 RepID=A0ACB8W770_9TELE|nr:hypothetical protein L3Q82_001266 [Scortum barcoo]